MQTNISTGPLSGAQFAALLTILEPFKAEPITPALLTLAARLARLEAAQ